MPKISDKLMSDITKPDRGQKIYRDSELKGFGLRVTPGSMASIVERDADLEAVYSHSSRSP
ncbi:hypothetical protein KF913_12220 [Candidatus Obscuribacterales bacterium]|nr:hypothetical protein [Candidatus Obscuribacterales bacterium]